MFECIIAVRGENLVPQDWSRNICLVDLMLRSAGAEGMSLGDN